MSSSTVQVSRNFRRDFFVWLAALVMLPHRLRPTLLRAGGIDVAASARIRAGLRIVGNAPVAIGENAFLNEGVYIEALAPVRIEPFVQIADHVRLITATHQIEPRGDRVAGHLQVGEMHIERGAWLGSGSTVLPGVRVGARAVLGAGAVATRELASNAIYVGVPAKLIRRIDAVETE